MFTMKWWWNKLPKFYHSLAKFEKMFIVFGSWSVNVGLICVISLKSKQSRWCYSWFMEFTNIFGNICFCLSKYKMVFNVTKVSRGNFYYCGLPATRAWICNDTHGFMWDVITQSMNVYLHLGHSIPIYLNHFSVNNIFTVCLGLRWQNKGLHYFLKGFNYLILRDWSVEHTACFFSIKCDCCHYVILSCIESYHACILLPPFKVTRSVFITPIRQVIFIFLQRNLPLSCPVSNLLFISRSILRSDQEQ